MFFPPLIRQALWPQARSSFAGVLQIRTLMPKPGKTHKGAAARFTLVRGKENRDKIIRSRQGKSHLNLNKSSSRLSRLRRPATVSPEQLNVIKRLLGR